MPYYIRVLSTSDGPPPFRRLSRSLTKADLGASLDLIAGKNRNWTELLLRHNDGLEIAAIEMSIVAPGSLAAEVLSEFSEEIEDARPKSAVTWLRQYFRSVRAIYAFQILGGADTRDGWEALERVKTVIWNVAPSIIQSDGEGFSNEDGYHILWQFSDQVTGQWWTAVLVDGDWAEFQMDLGNPAHREAFLAGRTPH